MSEEVKLFLKTDRGKAIIKLSLYFIFFLLIFVFIKPGNEEVYVPDNSIDKYSSMTNYEYTYQYDDTIYSGMVYRDIYMFNIGDITYYYDGSIYKVVDNKLISDTLNRNYYLDNHTISNYIKKGNIIGKNEDYENSVTATIYNVDDMRITLYEQNSLINKVSINQEEHYIEINYTKINEVTNFILDLEKE